MENLRQGKPVELDKWREESISKSIDLYVKMGRMKRSEDLLKTYSDFLEQIQWIKNNAETIVRVVVKKTEGMRPFLLAHSNFHGDAATSDDWFTRMMYYYLAATEEDVKSVTEKEDVPDSIMSMFSMFDPEKMTIIQIEPIRIEYAFYDQRDPINIIDEGWEREDRGRVVDVDVSAYATISTHSAPHITEDDDLPF